MFSELNQDLLSGIRVLCVNDHQDIVELMRVILSGYGAEIATAITFDHAIDLLDDFRPHILVCDIRLGDKTGYDLIAEVRHSPNPKERYMPAVAVTGMARQEDETKALDLGFSYVLKKPIDFDQLAIVIARLMNRLSVVGDAR